MSKKIKILYVVTTGLTLVTLAFVAVPPLMAEIIANQLKKHLKEEENND